MWLCGLGFRDLVLGLWTCACAGFFGLEILFWLAFGQFWFLWIVISFGLLWPGFS